MGDLRKLTHQELLERQIQHQKSPKLPFVVVLNNIRSLHNVGSIFRTADGLGIEKLWICGITGIPPASKISKTALGAEDVVPWEYHENAAQCVQTLKEQGFEIVLLEQTSRSQPYASFEPSRPVCLVIGNEVEGVDENILPLADHALEIEMIGLKNSLNVTVAFAVAAYQIRQKLSALVL